jgi:hypothetical protein
MHVRINFKIRVMTASLGKFGDEVQRLEVMIVVVNISLQDTGIGFRGSIRMHSDPLTCNFLRLCSTVLKMTSLHENVIIPVGPSGFVL